MWFTRVSHSRSVNHKLVVFTACESDETWSLSEIHLNVDCIAVRVNWLAHVVGKVAPERYKLGF